MRRLWIVIILVVSLAGSTCAAGEFSGRLFSLVDVAPGSVACSIHTDIDYTVSGWTLGFHSWVTENRIPLLALDAEGSMGAIHLYSIAGFKPELLLLGPPWEDGVFAAWNTVGTLSLGGASLYAIGAVSNHWYYDHTIREHPGEIGIGLRFGGWGVTGPITAYVETRFNITNDGFALPLYYWAYGFDEFVLGFRGIVEYGDWYGWTSWLFPNRFMIPQTPTCTLPWTGADIMVLVPVGCLDVIAYARFTDSGHFNLGVLVEHVDLGLDWVELGYFRVLFWTDVKMTDFAFGLDVAETVCIEPHFALDAKGTSIEGIALNALTLEYEVSPGILFKAGEKFTEFPWEDYISWSERSWSGWTAWGEIEPMHSQFGAFWWGTLFSTDYEEYIAIEVSGESCCGGNFDAFLYNWFDTEQTGAFMDWAETVVGLRVSISSNSTLFLNVFLDAGGLSELDLGFEFIW